VRRSRPFGVALVGMVMAFLAVLAMSGTETASPEARLPERYRLADLIERQQAATAELRREVEALRADVDEARAAGADRSASVGLRQIRVGELSDVAGIAEMKGPGLKVTLDDSDLRLPPDGANVNDLVIHSQDVQAVVNALWRSGAEAISINGQRLVSTSAVLCVGNTLLLNGTVHSPPYVVSALGADRNKFNDDALVTRLRRDAEAFGLKLSVRSVNNVSIPAYDGSATPKFARPAA
jgi:uncharacterized protein YlxW (UPF0749 family)